MGIYPKWERTADKDNDMKEYFNARDRANHIIVTAMQSIVGQLVPSETLSDTEREWLKAVEDNLKKFNSSIYGRMGDPYRRKVENTVKSNRIEFVGRYAESRGAISECASEDLQPCLDKLIQYNCMDCDKENYLDCPTYAIAVACDCDAKCDKGCPFKM